MTRPKKRKAPEALARSEAQEDGIDGAIIDSLADTIKARLMAGEVVNALDIDEDARPLFWAAIARVRDDLPAVKPTWRTVSERHVDGIRTRQKLFRIFPRRG